ncbi:MAG: hypothetical protein ACI8XB_003315 [Patiriisocius sp.]|jgi:hypothetical protein
MRNFVILLCTLLTSSLNAQDSSYKTKEYDKEIFLNQMKQVEEKEIDKATYLINSKPFSKWDPRPLNDSLVWVMNELQTASIIPNFFWGSFSNYYGVKLKEAQALPNTFLKNAFSQEKDRKKYFEKNKKTFSELTKLLLKSDKTVYMKQGELARVNELYREDNQYWEYVIASDSPFPLSDSINIEVPDSFGEDESILTIIDKLDIYAVYNDSDGIFFMIDGVLDNSYGFVYQKGDDEIKSNHLFDISLKTEIDSKYYYYVAK